MSEYPENVEPAKYMFPRRNRIISGLSEATVVVQAGNNSGALITAELAAEQGRNIYAVPGNINNIYSLGSNKLLQDGAMPLVVLDDILTDMGVQSLAKQSIQNLLGKDENQLFKALEREGEMSIDDLSHTTGQSIQEVNGIITVLEMKDIVFTSLGKVFIAK